MGQYYVIANMDKKEALCLDGRYPGMKLMEISLQKDASRALLNQFAGSWKGDHVYLVGDYADLSVKNVPYFQALRTWTDKFHLVDSLYRYAYDTFTKIDGDPEDKGYRFIYNHDLKDYIDIAHCPESHDETDFWQSFISPLPLLIAMGNGRGGGDYHTYENSGLVGSWCDSIASVEVTIEPKDELGFEEVHPDFYE